MSQTLPGAYEGEDVPIRVTFTDDTDSEIAPDGASGTTPTGPSITITAPDGSTAVSSTVMTGIDTGTYEYVWDTTADSTGTGTYQVEVTGEFSSETKIAKATIQIS